MEELPFGDNGLVGDGGPGGTDATFNIGDGAVGQVDSAALRDGASGDGGDGGVGDDAGTIGDASTTDATTSDDAGATAIVYVANFGDDKNDGSRTAPRATIQAGIRRALEVGAKKVHIAAGDYHNDPNDPLKVADKISLLGGWDCGNVAPGGVCAWTGPNTTQGNTTVFSSISEGVVASNISDETVISGLRFVGSSKVTGNAPNGAAGMTISGGAPKLVDDEFLGDDIESAPALGSRSVGLVIEGDAKPFLSGCQARSGVAIDESIGILLMKANGGSPSVVMKGGVIASGSALNSVGLFVKGSASSTHIEGVEITAGRSTATSSWAVDALAPLKLIANRINLPARIRPPTLPPAGPAPFCNNSAAGDLRLCGGVRAQAGITLQSNYIGGVLAARSAAVVLAPEGPSVATSAAMVVNGNTLDGGGIGMAAGPAEPGTVSAAIVVRATAQTGKVEVGDVRNNILLGGSNDARYGVYELVPAANTNKITAHLKSLSSNDFFDVVFAYKYYDADTDGFLFPSVPQVATLVKIPNNQGPSFDLPPKFLPNDPYHLDPASPLVDKGTSESQTLDIDLKARPTVGVAGGNTKLMDIGADETNN